MPLAPTDSVRAPAVTLTPGSPNRFWSAGARKIPLCPLPYRVMEPSGGWITFAGPDTFSVMAFPVPGFVNVILREPVTRVVMDPSEALSTFSYSLAAGSVTRILNPQNNAGRVKGFSSWNSHLGPRPARAGEAVSSPPSMPSSAPSATITPSRLMTITPHSAATERGLVPGIILRPPETGQSWRGEVLRVASGKYRRALTLRHRERATFVPDDGWRRVHWGSSGGHPYRA